MEFTYKETLTKKLDIKFPAFVKSGEYYYKIIDKTNLLIVTDFSFNKSISFTISEHHNPFSNNGWEFISEDEFNEVHKSVSDELSLELKIEKTCK